MLAAIGEQMRRFLGGRWGLGPFPINSTRDHRKEYIYGARRKMTKQISIG